MPFISKKETKGLKNRNEMCVMRLHDKAGGLSHQKLLPISNLLRHIKEFHVPKVPSILHGLLTDTINFLSCLFYFSSRQGATMKP